MISFLTNINAYIKYVYVFLLVVLLIVLLYLFANLIKLLPNLSVTLNGVNDVTLKLNHAKESTDKIKVSYNRNLPLIAGGLGIISFLQIYRRAMKRRKKNNKKYGVIRSLVDEYEYERKRSLRNKNIVNAAKTIGPIVNTVRSTLR